MLGFSLLIVLCNSTHSTFNSGVGYRFLRYILDKNARLTEIYLWCMKFRKILKNNFLDISCLQNTPKIEKYEVCTSNVSVFYVF